MDHNIFQSARKYINTVKYKGDDALVNAQLSIKCRHVIYTVQQIIVKNSCGKTISLYLFPRWHIELFYYGSVVYTPSCNQCSDLSALV